MALAARLGQGWITTGEKTSDIEEWWRSVAEAARRFPEASTVDRYLSLDAAPVFSLSSPAYFAEAVARAAELGFTDVVTHWPRAGGWYAGSESVLDRVAPLLAR
jgi:alkanesulfonate monooxygenase SsuD/methylene tetrahydromethanopterin reductase-like flavin-dependent oxidoreductase (luciferase family)